MKPWLALTLSQSAMLGCHAPSVFECLATSECADGSASGTCEPTGYCSFTDPTCASGRRYDPSAGMDLAGACVTPAADADHDGVPDDVDNCVDVANSTQGNEDGDRFGDACDPCPAFFDGDQLLDSDGDGITDLCDPHFDASAPDRIGLFEGFHDGIPTTWAGTAAWTAPADALHVVGDGELTVPAPTTTTGDVRLFVGLQIVTLGAGAAQFGILANGVSCEFTQLAPGTSQRLQLRDAPNGKFGEVGYGFAAGAYVLVLRWDHGQAWSCNATESGSIPTTVTGTQSPPGPDTIGITNQGNSIQGDVEFVMVVGR